MTNLTLPGDIPGLLRMCSPVVFTHEGPQLKGVILRLWGPGCSVAVAEPEPIRRDDLELLDTSPSVFALDLTDATGRAHANAWLRGGRMGGPDLTLYCGVGGLHWFGGHPERDPSDVWPGGFNQPVPGLALVNPQHPGTLPDGSRWVDAEALRRVVLHLAGRAA